jgi:hypothetical protein
MTDPKPLPPEESAPRERTRECEWCEGTGIAPTGEAGDTCQACSGLGRMPARCACTFHREHKQCGSSLCECYVGQPEAARRRERTRDEWVAGAQRDYTRLAEALRARGIMEWDDTVDAVLALLPPPGQPEAEASPVPTPDEAREGRARAAAVEALHRIEQRLCCYEPECLTALARAGLSGTSPLPGCSGHPEEPPRPPAAPSPALTRETGRAMMERSFKKAEGEEPPRGAATSEEEGEPQPVGGPTRENWLTEPELRAIILDQRVLLHASEEARERAEQEREALREGEAEMRNRAARVVDWYFTTYFSKSPGSKTVEELVGLIQTLQLRAALAGAPQGGQE